MLYFPRLYLALVVLRLLVVLTRRLLAGIYNQKKTCEGKTFIFIHVNKPAIESAKSLRAATMS